MPVKPEDDLREPQAICVSESECGRRLSTPVQAAASGNCGAAASAAVAVSITTPVVSICAMPEPRYLPPQPTPYI